MSLLSSRWRSPVVAVVALALSATVALAARPVNLPSGDPMPGPQSSAEPTASADPLPSPSAPAELPAPSGDVDADPEPTDDSDEDSAEGTGAHPDNHGALVSEAARGETPDGFTNHGAWVRSVARGEEEATAGTERATKRPAETKAPKTVKPAKSGDHGKAKTSR